MINGLSYGLTREAHIRGLLKNSFAQVHSSLSCSDRKQRQVGLNKALETIKPFTENTQIHLIDTKLVTTPSLTEILLTEANAFLQVLVKIAESGCSGTFNNSQIHLSCSAFRPLNNPIVSRRRIFITVGELYQKFGLTEQQSRNGSLRDCLKVIEEKRSTLSIEAALQQLQPHFEAFYSSIRDL